MQDRIILDLCSGTGAWSDPYLEAGYGVVEIDLDQGFDVRTLELPRYKVHGIFAAPPCTHLAGSGARWWAGKGPQALIDNLSIVDACLRIIMFTNPVWWVLENPVGRLVRFIGKPTMYFQPWEYGDPYTKKTCLWGNFNIPIKTPVEPVEGGKIWKMAPSPERTKLRSITPQGFANAFFKANP